MKALHIFERRPDGPEPIKAGIFTGPRMRTSTVVFRDALAVAQGQGSKAYELRAATRFAGWLRSRGRFAEGLQLVATLYAGFTEGFDTPDLREAKQVIDEGG